MFAYWNGDINYSQSMEKNLHLIRYRGVWLKIIFI